MATKKSSLGPDPDQQDPQLIALLDPDPGSLSQDYGSADPDLDPKEIFTVHE